MAHELADAAHHGVKAAARKGIIARRRFEAGDRIFMAFDPWAADSLTGLARHVRRAAKPNAHIERACVVAATTILPGTEITIDYAASPYHRQES